MVAFSRKTSTRLPSQSVWNVCSRTNMWKVSGEFYSHISYCARTFDGKEGEKPEANMKVYSSSFGIIGGLSAGVGEYVWRRRVVGGFI